MRKWTPTVGSLFSGIGTLDLGFEMAGYDTRWFCEVQPKLQKFLTEKWPGRRVYSDVKDLLTEQDIEPVSILCGGDPCPKHSRARGGRPTQHPDLSGYLLAVAGRLRPRWLVRENVPTPSVAHVAAALEHIGYGAVVIRMDATLLTRQSRIRDIIVARDQTTRGCVREIFSECEGNPRNNPKSAESAFNTFCARQRFSALSSYIYQDGRIRSPSPEEMEYFTGIPAGWTNSLSACARASAIGNAAIPQWFWYIGKTINVYENSLLGT